MQNDQAKHIARLILEDRQGADYYNDPEVLTDLLRNTLQVTENVAQLLAQNIREDQ